MRLRSAFALAIGTCTLGAPAVASAGLPVGFTGPTFTDGPPPSFSNWKYSVTRSTLDDPPPSFYLPGIGNGNGNGNYSDAHNAEGLFTPNPHRRQRPVP